ncbi:hypothetical protein T440DRAFT_308044 [Plenodomus tracheiphilus IPT5]|uniref:Uncharacterized protein n=1 Tax=Plenodomus tracheiphilus IPT5 TaxID=1408161 RepID=A0A6A7BDN9_9PLEO|nr:hypothetical protein T440DRAFT_308044 [Plenodomus tracheiphilus IPT5]
MRHAPQCACSHRRANPAFLTESLQALQTVSDYYRVNSIMTSHILQSIIGAWSSLIGSGQNCPGHHADDCERNQKRSCIEVPRLDACSMLLPCLYDVRTFDSAVSSLRACWRGCLLANANAYKVEAAFSFHSWFEIISCSFFRLVSIIDKGVESGRLDNPLHIRNIIKTCYHSLLFVLP